jgi:hypothetical protein
MNTVGKGESVQYEYLCPLLLLSSRSFRAVSAALNRPRVVRPVPRDMAVDCGMPGGEIMNVSFEWRM